MADHQTSAASTHQEEAFQEAQGCQCHRGRLPHRRRRRRRLRGPRRDLLPDYSLGVLDKASGTLKIVPIAANKDKKWKLLNEQRNDPSAFLDLDLGNSETNVDANDVQATIVQNILPYDPAADTSEKAYLFDEIIPKSYGSFVSNHVKKLQELQGEGKEKLAWILSYITHLLSLAWNSSMSKRHRKENQASHGPVILQAVVYRKLLLMFTVPGSSALSTDKHELLINYILVLMLYADDFRSDPTDIRADLKITYQIIKPYYDQLGCNYANLCQMVLLMEVSVMTLPAPLKFPQEVTREKAKKANRKKTLLGW
ncbi:hypothetical protein GUJ93_ZPchr0011g28041 [Zizania palustris]|uniref:Uncharacterized protein n=1 Tax=Zizania palustris TaxID=103762 RepID=A0A8J5WKG4_ZIZPA|nr:hypothetical protein GUJ93_ZPchr0011g28041 [Zizania palustris]